MFAFSLLLFRWLGCRRLLSTQKSTSKTRLQSPKGNANTANCTMSASCSPKVTRSTWLLSIPMAPLRFTRSKRSNKTTGKVTTPWCGNVNLKGDRMVLLLETAIERTGKDDLQFFQTAYLYRFNKYADVFGDVLAWRTHKEVPQYVKDYLKYLFD